MKLITKFMIGIDVIIVFCFLTVYGPIDNARVFWITTAMETMNHKYLAHIFYSNKTIDNVLKENYYIELKDETDISKVIIGKVENKKEYSSIYEKQVLDHEENEEYKLIEFKYNEFDCYMVAIYNPKRIQAAVTEKLGQGEILTDIAKRNNAIVAINGGGYSWSTYKPSGLIVNQGKTIYKESNGSFLTAAFNKDGILIAGSLSSNELEEKNIQSALSFGPALIINGNPITIRGTGGSGINPRTVIAQRKDGVVLFLVVNGYGKGLSWKGRGGVYLNDLLVILKRYGAYNAVNMDGGSSTTMVINDKLINTPCEPQKDGQDFIRSAWIFK